MIEVGQWVGGRRQRFDLCSVSTGCDSSPEHGRIFRLDSLARPVYYGGHLTLARRNPASNSGGEYTVIIESVEARQTA